MTEITLLLLQNSCRGFVPTGRAFYASSSSLWQTGERWQPKQQHQPFRLAAAATTTTTTHPSDQPSSSISSILATENKNEIEGTEAVRYSTKSTSFSLELLSPPRKSRRRKAWNSVKKKLLFWRNGSDESGSTNSKPSTLDFNYDYDVIDIPVGTAAPTKTTGVMLIHPIGVGISRWYYQRLVSSLVAKNTNSGERLVVVVPDLLGSGSACNITTSTTEHKAAKKFPLFNISDWTDQVEDLMSLVETAPPSDGVKIDQWCVVANGGCSPIALQLAQRKNNIQSAGSASEAAPVSKLVLSSVPRLPFFLKNETTNDPEKVAKSYRTLSGIPGKLFWWYSCRNKGAFIQTFSEKNLIADPKNLGPTWRSNCYETATSFEGKGKYATFSFLAGNLQDGCLPSLEAIKDTSLEIEIIKGVDVRRNRAKSWFWQKPKKSTTKKDTEDDASQAEEVPDATAAKAADVDADASDSDAASDKPHETFRDYVEKNGNGGRERVIGGRISLAHEDPEGYADAVLQFLSDS